MGNLQKPEWNSRDLPSARINTSTTGVITASAIQDGNGQPLVMSFGLPT